MKNYGSTNLVMKNQKFIQEKSNILVNSGYVMYNI